MVDNTLIFDVFCWAFILLIIWAAICQLKEHNQRISIAHQDGNSGITLDDIRQFWQLLGYSVSGYGDLSFVDKKVVAEADKKVKMMLKKKSKNNLRRA